MVTNGLFMALTAFHVVPYSGFCPSTFHTSSCSPDELSADSIAFSERSLAPFFTFCFCVATGPSTDVCGCSFAATSPAVAEHCGLNAVAKNATRAVRQCAAAFVGGGCAVDVRCGSS